MTCDLSDHSIALFELILIEIIQQNSDFDQVGPLWKRISMKTYKVHEIWLYKARLV